ncbi:MAG: hypothetical protein ACOCXX_05820 [Planctomycetota bacterium]
MKRLVVLAVLLFGAALLTGGCYVDVDDDPYDDTDPIVDVDT